MAYLNLKNKTFIAPSFFTTLNILCGTSAILFAVNQYFITASWMIIIAVLCDGMDGKLARWVQCETEFGMQLDSLADLVSSGIAPMVLIYQAILKAEHWSHSWVCLLYVFAGAYRLARFNVTQKGDRSNGYIGLPIPVAAMTIAAYWLFIESMGIHPGWIWMTGLVIGFSLLMIGTMPYEWPKLDWHNGFWAVYSIFLLLAVASMVLFTRFCLFPLLCLYIIIGVCRWIISVIRESLFVDAVNK